MKCPECKTGTVAFCQNAIVAYEIKADHSIGEIIETNALDNCWLECNDCSATSDTSEKLDKVFRKV